MQLSDLYLYPIKSTAPLPVCEARVEPCGLQHDRRWMVVDADGRFLTGRQLPRLTLVRALPHENGLLLEAPGMPSLPVVFASALASVPVRPRFWISCCILLKNRMMKSLRPRSPSGSV